MKLIDDFQNKFFNLKVLNVIEIKLMKRSFKKKKFELFSFVMIVEIMQRIMTNLMKNSM